MCVYYLWFGGLQKRYLSLYRADRQAGGMTLKKVVFLGGILKPRSVTQVHARTRTHKTRIDSPRDLINKVIQ